MITTKQITTLMSVCLLSFTPYTTAKPNDVNLSYQYDTPYTGAGKITLYNNAETSIILTQFNFNANGDISGSPWGDLSDGNIPDAKKDADGIHVNYSLKGKPTTIPAHSAVSVTYPVGTLYGAFKPHNILMGPTTVTAQIKLKTDSDPIQVTVPIKNICTGAACQDPGNGKLIIGYYPDWAYWRNPKYLANEIPFKKVNSVIYAFSIFDEDGKVSLYDKDSDAVNMPKIAEARQQYPYLNASLSFGGWSWFSTPPGWKCATGESPQGPAACFSKMAANPTAVDNFVAGAISGMKSMNFNGIDIDWEYVEAKDAESYVTLLTKLRAALDKQGQLDKTHYRLSIAAPAGIFHIKDITNEQWKKIFEQLDYVGIMTYDFHGAWDQKTDFMSAMELDPNNDPTAKDPTLKQYNVMDAIKAYQDRGLTPEKLVVGIPMYGRMTNIKTAGATKGLYQDITGVSQGEWDNQQSGFTGMLNYSCIVDRSACGNQYVLPNLTIVNPTQDPLGQFALTPWGFNADKFITFDDATSAAYKAKWVKKNNFAGVMVWDFSGDFRNSNDNRSIIKAIQNTFAVG